MRDLTMDELTELLAALDLSTPDDRDELLTELLLRGYPTRATQDN